MIFVSRPSIPTDIPKYTLHQYLWGFFPQTTRDSPRPFVFLANNDRVVVVSSIEPKTAFKEASLNAGMSYSIDAIIAPGKSESQGFRKDGVGPKSKKIPITGNAKRRKWLGDLLEKNGISLVHCHWFDRNPLRFKHGDGNVIRVFPARVTAIISVFDAPAAERLITTGIGRSRAFGCGLLYIPELMDN